MDDIEYLSENFGHLARFAIEGRPKDAAMLIQRVQRRMASRLPALSDGLGEILKTSKRSSSITRKLRPEALPEDKDSRLPLLKTARDVILDTEPIWSANVRADLAQVVAERKALDEIFGAGLSPARSILLCGPPGVGKSLAAKWIARETGKPLMTLDLSAVMSSFLGRTGSNLKRVFEYARGIDAILFLDELDAIAKRRDDNAELGELKRLVTVLLQEIDAWPEDGLLVAATNHDSLLDPAAWRRFDVLVRFELPSAPQRESALKQFFAKHAADKKSKMLISALSIATEGLSFADIKNLSMKLRRQAVLSKSPVSQLLLDHIAQRVVPMRKDERIAMSLALREAGISQRTVSDMTGLSRDKIRKEERESDGTE